MPVVTIDEARAHLGVIHNDGDADIQLKLDAATQHAADFIKRDLPWKDSDGVDVAPPAPVKAAILLILGGLFESREQIITGTIVAENPVVAQLLWPYRLQGFF